MERLRTPAASQTHVTQQATFAEGPRVLRPRYVTQRNNLPQSDLTGKPHQVASTDIHQGCTLEDRPPEHAGLEEGSKDGIRCVTEQAIRLTQRYHHQLSQHATVTGIITS